MTATVRSVKVGDLSISIAEAGEGGRPLLLQHGFTGAKEDFADWYVPLADRGWHVVAPDLRGHGASDHPKGRGSYNLALFQSDLLGVVDSLGWDRFTLLGHSLGGMISQGIAVDHPERLEALVLMDTTAEPVDMQIGKVKTAIFGLIVRIGGMGVMASVARKPPPGSPESVHRVFAERPDFVEWTQSKIRNTSKDAAGAVMGEMTARGDQTEKLRGIAVPTLIIVGGHDIPGFLESSRRMADTIEGAQFVLIEEAAHNPQIETPEAWWEALSTFLDALPSSPATTA